MGLRAAVGNSSIKFDVRDSDCSVAEKKRLLLLLLLVVVVVLVICCCCCFSKKKTDDLRDLLTLSYFRIFALKLKGL